MIPIRAYGLPSWSSAWPSARAIKWVPLRRAAKTNSEEQPKILQFIRRGMLLRNTVTLLFSAAHLRRILANTPSITMRYGVTFRLRRTRHLRVRSSASETLSRIRSLADYTIITREFEFSKATGGNRTCRWFSEPRDQQNGSSPSRSLRPARSPCRS